MILVLRCMGTMNMAGEICRIKGHLFLVTWCGVWE
jgi:hypothetical protein